MATDTGDIISIGSSAAQGAAAGSVFGAPGAIVGGTVGFFSGVLGNNAESAAEDAALIGMKREKEAAAISGEAARLERILTKLQVDRGRKEFSRNAFLNSEAIRAGEAVTGLVGSSIAKNAKASLNAQTASNLNFSYQTEQMGDAISVLLQEAADKRAGVNQDTSLFSEGSTFESLAGTEIAEENQADYDAGELVATGVSSTSWMGKYNK